MKFDSGIFLTSWRLSEIYLSIGRTTNGNVALTARCPMPLARVTLVNYLQCLVLQVPIVPSQVVEA